MSPAKKIVASALAGAAMLGGASAALTTATASAATGTYNVRAYPSTSAPVIGKLYNPTCKSVDWTRVNQNRPAGWTPAAGGWVYNDGWCV